MSSRPSTPAHRWRFTPASSWSRVPPVIPAPGVINRLSASPPSTRCGIARRHNVREGRAAVDPAAYFHPLDTGRRLEPRSTERGGFVQYQFVVPLGAEQNATHRHRAHPRRGCVDRSSSPCSSASGRAIPVRLELSRSRAGRWRSTCQPACVGLFAAARTDSTRLVLDAGGRPFAKDFQGTTPTAVRARVPTPRPSGSPSVSAVGSCGRVGQRPREPAGFGPLDPPMRQHRLDLHDAERTSGNHRRSCCSAGPARSAGRSSTSCWRPLSADAGAGVSPSRTRAQPRSACAA